MTPRRVLGETVSKNKPKSNHKGSQTSLNSYSEHHNNGENDSSCSNSSQSDNRLTSVLYQLEPDEDTNKVSIGDIMETLSTRGFGPLLFAPALIAIMPTGGIPGVPTVCGVIIALISVQMLLGKEQPWLPEFINKVDFDQDKLHKGINIASKATQWIDKIVKPRLELLCSNKAKKVAALLCIFAALAMIPLEIVPFAVMIPAAAIILFAISFITHDGYVFLAALFFSLMTAYFLISHVIMG